MSDVRLFCYKMTADTGFAPNPFGGSLTLATCKPGIRRSKIKDDWIAGFTSKKLCGDPVGEEKMVYLMQVAEKFPIADYFGDSRFQAKKPQPTSNRAVEWCGDNIYRPIVRTRRAPRITINCQTPTTGTTTANTTSEDAVSSLRTVSPILAAKRLSSRRIFAPRSRGAGRHMDLSHTIPS